MYPRRLLGGARVGGEVPGSQDHSLAGPPLTLVSTPPGLLSVQEQTHTINSSNLLSKRSALFVNRNIFSFQPKGAWNAVERYIKSEPRLLPEMQRVTKYFQETMGPPTRGIPRPADPTAVTPHLTFQRQEVGGR